MTEPRDHPHKNLSLSRKTEGGKGDRNSRCDPTKLREGIERVFDKTPWYEDRDMSWLEEDETTEGDNE